MSRPGVVGGVFRDEILLLWLFEICEWIDPAFPGRKISNCSVRRFKAKSDSELMLRYLYNYYKESQMRVIVATANY